MKPFTLVKISDLDNLLGYEEIIIIDQRVQRKFIHKELLNFHEEGGIKKFPSETYVYEYLAIADGNFTIIKHGLSHCLYTCYKYKEQE